MDAIRVHGRNFDKIENAVETKSYQQCRDHLCKFQQEIKADPNTEGADLLDKLEEEQNKDGGKGDFSPRKFLESTRV